MIDKATATYPAADERSQRYRHAERTLWAHYDLEPTERFVELDAPAVRLRVLEVGSGDPVLLIHGTGGPGSLASLVNELSGFRCLMLDRPGWGLSSPIDYAQHDYKSVVADLLSGVLDGLSVDQAHVIGASIGNNWALRLAQKQPSRVGRTVLLGGSPLVPEIPVPSFIRLLSSPIGAVIVRLPLKPKMVQGQLRQLGHGPSLDAGRIPDEFIEWRLALDRESDSMPSERDMVRAIASFRTGFKPGLQFADAELAAIQQPTLYVYGTADPVGTVDIWRRAVGLLPRGELRLMDDGGHMPWFDDPSQVAGHVTRFLST